MDSKVKTIQDEMIDNVMMNETLAKGFVQRTGIADGGEF